MFFAKCITAGLTVFLLLKTIGVTQIAAAIKKVDPAKLSVASLLLIPNLVIQILKWRFMLGWTGTTISLWTSSKSILAGYPLGFVTPGRLGEIGRAFWIEEIPKRKTLGLALLDKLSNMAVTLLAGGISVAWFFRTNYPLLGVLAGGLTLLATMMAASIFKKNFRNRIEMLTGAAFPGQVRVAFVYAFAILFYVVFTAQFVLLVDAFESAPYALSICAAGAVFLTKTILPISLSDLGIREGAAIFFFEYIGVGAGAAMNAAFCLFLVNVCLPTLAGIPILLKSKINVKASHSIP